LNERRVIELDVPQEDGEPFCLCRLGPWSDRLRVVVEDANEQQLASLDVAPGQRVVFYLPAQDDGQV
jgi:hypothetical protein